METGILLESGTNELEILEFRVGKNLYGINVAKVREILSYQDPTPVPNADARIEGIFMPRDEIISVIDLARCLGMVRDEQTTDNDMYIVTNFNKLNAAFHVSAVQGIHRVSWEDIIKPDSTVNAAGAGMATGIVRIDGNLIIIVNDNDMSIAENHGGLYGNLKLLRETNGQAECNLFKAMGLDYVYVHEGNDIPALIKAFESVKDSVKPVVVHIRTLKGKGYKLAETHKEEWHWHLPFDIETGEVIADFGGEDYSSVTCDYLMKKMKEDTSVVTITSATPTVMGFTEDKRKEAGRQFVDVGIAEETAVALASGIAKSGGKPVYGVYSTFIQRTYDQLAQDLCVNGNPATILTFSASIYGMNDVTHLGIYDIPMMANIPGLVYLAPTTKEEYLAMLDWSIAQTESTDKDLWFGKIPNTHTILVPTVPITESTIGTAEYPIPRSAPGNKSMIPHRK